MARNRKANADTSSSSESPQNLEISEEEQWRLVNETGILKRAIPPSSAVVEVEEQEDTPLAEEIFNSVTLIIPFSFLLLMFEIKSNTSSIWETTHLQGSRRQNVV